MAKQGQDTSSAGQAGTELRSWCQPLRRVSDGRSWGCTGGEQGRGASTLVPLSRAVFWLFCGWGPQQKPVLGKALLGGEEGR